MKSRSKQAVTLRNLCGRLVEVADLPTAGGRLPVSGGAGASGATFSSGEIKVPLGEIGEDAATK